MCLKEGAEHSFIAIASLCVSPLSHDSVINNSDRLLFVVKSIIASPLLQTDRAFNSPQRNKKTVLLLRLHLDGLCDTVCCEVNLILVLPRNDYNQRKGVDEY